MKVTELMIGDWVYNSLTDLTFQVYPQFFSQWSNRLEQFIAIIKPIPLTPEILEKNGFKYKEGEIGMYGVEITPCYLRDDVPFEVFCDGEPFAIWFKEPISIKYVHQLQHALRLCGIEKEIVL